MHSTSKRLIKWMDEPLPGLYQQKRLLFRPDIYDMIAIYRTLNYAIFDNELNMPRMRLAPRCRTYWGICMASYDKDAYTKSYCTIKMMDKWFCRQWFITVLAHEMSHQYQWDILGEERNKEGKESIMSHGPSFFYHRDRMAEHGISLKTSHSQGKWFKHQDFFKC